MAVDVLSGGQLYESDATGGDVDDALRGILRPATGHLDTEAGRDMRGASRTGRRCLGVRSLLTAVIGAVVLVSGQGVPAIAGPPSTPGRPSPVQSPATASTDPAPPQPPMQASVGCPKGHHRAAQASGKEPAATPGCARIDTSRLGQSPAGRVTAGAVAAADTTIPSICPPTLSVIVRYDRFVACEYVPVVWLWIDQDGTLSTIKLDLLMWANLRANIRNFTVHAILTPTSIVPAGRAFTGKASLSCTAAPLCTTSPTIPVDGELGTLVPGRPVAASFDVFDQLSTTTDYMNTQLALSFTPVGMVCTACLPAVGEFGAYSPIRCDDEINQNGYQNGGCVFYRARPTWQVSDANNPGMALVAKHMAIATGALPGYQDLPGDPGRYTPLTYAPQRESANRAVACPASLKPPPGEDAKNDTCDEYPLASTLEGAASGDPYSICWVPHSQNSSQGGFFSGFRAQNRLLSNPQDAAAGDQFYVHASYGGTDPACKDKLGGGGTVTPDTYLNNLFNDYGDHAGCADWSGGDATNSVLLPDGQRAWFFSDSYLNSPADRKSLWYFSFVHNSIVVQGPAGIRKTMTGGNTCQETNQLLSFWDRYAKTPAAASDGGFFWTGDQRVVGSNVVKFYYHGHSFTLPDGSSSFSIDYSAVAVIPVSSLEGSDTVATINPVRFTCGSSAITWGTALLDWNGAVYVYGWQNTGAGSDRIYLAKTTASGLTSPGSWQVYTGTSGANPTWGGCGSSPAALAISKGTTGFSVVPVNNSLWLIQFDYTHAWPDPAGSIGAHPSSTPWGFGNRTIPLYTPPGTGVLQSPHYYQQYEARVQPGLAAGQVVISYNVNTFAVDTGCVSANVHDTHIYRPRFISVPNTLFNPAAAAAAPGTATPATTASPGNPFVEHGIRNSGPPLAAGHRPVSPTSVAPTAGPTSALAATSGIDGSTDWFYLPPGGSCPTVKAPATKPEAFVDAHGIVHATWPSVGTDVWYYAWICDATMHDCSSQDTSFPWLPAWPTGNGNLWTTAPEGFLDPIDLTTSPEADTNGHRFAIYIQSFGAGNANSGGKSPIATVTVSR